MGCIHSKPDLGPNPRGDELHEQSAEGHHGGDKQISPEVELRQLLGYFLDRCLLYEYTGLDVHVACLRVLQAISDKSRDNPHTPHFILTGSFAEGMPPELCGDVDVMAVFPDLPEVLTGRPLGDSTGPATFTHTGYVVGEDNPQQPAYLKLAVPDITRIHPDVLPACVPEDGRYYLSAQVLVLLLMSDGDALHGPALSCLLSGETTMDLVSCLRCPSWPPGATDFLRRPRPHDRPPSSLLHRLARSGCHVVAKGHPSSHQRELEWRWSFSAAEKEIIHSFDPAMTGALYVLKTFKKNIWNDDCTPDTENGICSYYFKTACLVVNEMSASTAGVSSLALARIAIDWLISCYREHRLPYYFIPNQNLISQLPPSTCKEVADILSREKSNLDMYVLSRVLQSRELGDITIYLMGESCFCPLDGDSDLQTATALWSALRDHEKSREILVSAAAMIGPERMQQRRNDLGNLRILSVLENLSMKDFRHLSPGSGPVQSPDGLFLPVLGSLEHVVQEKCVGTLRLALYKVMAGLYHGLADGSLEQPGEPQSVDAQTGESQPGEPQPRELHSEALIKEECKAKAEEYDRKCLPLLFPVRTASDMQI